MYINGNKFISAKLINPCKRFYEIRYIEDDGHVMTKCMPNDFLKSMNIYSLHSRVKGNNETIAISFNSDKSRPLFIKIRETKMSINNILNCFHLEQYDAYCKLRTLYYAIDAPMNNVFTVLNSFGDHLIYDLYIKLCKSKPYGKTQERIASLLSMYKFNKLKYDHQYKKYIKV